MLIAHYDDLVAPEGDPETYAPGADDNASGVAATFKVARVFREMDFQPEQSIVFIACAAEELMYYSDTSGAEHYVVKAAANGDDIQFVYNNDVIAFDEGNWKITLFNVEGCEDIRDLVIEMLQTYTTLEVNLPDPVPSIGGDLQPFLDNGFTGAYLMEYDFNPYYHSN